MFSIFTAITSKENNSIKFFKDIPKEIMIWVFHRSIKANILLSLFDRKFLFNYFSLYQIVGQFGIFSARQI